MKISIGLAEFIEAHGVAIYGGVAVRPKEALSVASIKSISAKRMRRKMKTLIKQIRSLVKSLAL